jgi:hypothetical protein
LVTFDERSEQVKNQWMVLVDVIGEIERERHPLHVLTVAPDGSQTTPAMAQRLVECLPSDLAHGARVISLHVDRRALVLKNRYGRVGHWFETMQEIPPPPEEGLGPEPGILAPRVTDLARAHFRPEAARGDRNGAATLVIEHGTLDDLNRATASPKREPDEATAVAYGTWDGDRATADRNFAERIDSSADRAMGQELRPEPGTKGGV